MKKTIAIVGGGPAAMMLAAQLDPNLFDVSIYEKNAALGRKFLVAGKGGFNLTHSELLPEFINRYAPASFFETLLNSFSNRDLQKWLTSIGINTYVGSSQRVFPVKGIKPIEVLNAILKQLEIRKVRLLFEYHWKGFDASGKLTFETPSGIQKIKADIIVFALGGASWKVTGSDGAWSNYFAEKNISCSPFEASNCAFHIDWPSGFILKNEGSVLKNCSFRCGDKENKGEAVITRFGIEGSGVYPLSGEIRKELKKNKKAELFVDLKPQLKTEQIKMRFTARGRKSLSAFLENDLKLNGVKLAILKTFLSKEEFTLTDALVHKIKNFPFTITALATLDEAISTTGGIPLSEIDSNFQLKKLPDHYTIGEMLDWDAPTGGYLLQGCFSMGVALARHLNFP